MELVLTITIVLILGTILSEIIYTSYKFKKEIKHGAKQANKILDDLYHTILSVQEIQAKGIE
jgi:hypothetical protein